MKAAVATAPSQSLAQRFKQRLLHGYFVRIHMSLILAAVTASGVLASKGLLVAGVVSLRFRYPVAVLCSYLVFLGLVRIWIWYVCRRRALSDGSGGFDLGNFDLPGGGGGSSGGGGGSGIGPVRFGGGSSGGGGASSLWEADAAVSSSAPVPVSSGGGSGWSLPDIDLGDDGWAILLLLAALILAIVLAGGYLIYAAPQILPEAAWQAVLASTLTRVKKDDHHGWMGSVFKSTVLPFVVVMILAGALGWVAHKHCPQAAKLVEVFSCKAE